MTYGIGWTDERVKMLKELWKDGLSASEIATQLGGVTRNAVIGKVHRVGLSGRVAPSKPRHIVYRRKTSPKPIPTKASPRKRRSRPTASAMPPVTAVPYLECVSEPGLATIFTLGAHMCKWPIGDPSSDGFTYCGRRLGQNETGAYCSSHAR